MRGSYELDDKVYHHEHPLTFPSVLEWWTIRNSYGRVITLNTCGFSVRLGVLDRAVLAGPFDSLETAYAAWEMMQ